MSLKNIPSLDNHIKMDSRWEKKIIQMKDVWSTWFLTFSFSLGSISSSLEGWKILLNQRCNNLEIYLEFKNHWSQAHLPNCNFQTLVKHLSWIFKTSNKIFPTKIIATRKTKNQLLKIIINFKMIINQKVEIKQKVKMKIKISLT